ncbi:hypothetical protein [Streptomyces marokkonensis]|uniref:hypothetical protein n=1 Tax=Streptomyces marokkonensis TaxID=324855 RepID=UPI0011F317CF|nr:hypothetical protein [Streptomyces marokkonensis]
MGIRLIVEVLDHWQDAGLTAGEKGDLLVLAENANDKSRETWGPVHAPHILKRAGKSAASWRISINRLMKKKALEFAKRDGKEIRGYTGQHAVYRLVELCSQPPHEGYKGHCTRPAKDAELTAEDTQGEGNPTANPVSEDQEEGYLTANPEGYLTANAVDGLGYLTDTERVSGQLTPSPPVSSFKETPLTTPSSSVAEDAPEASVESTEGGGGGGEIPSEEQDQNDTRAAALVAKLDYRGKTPDKQQQKQLRALVAAALTAGWTERGLTRYLDISDDLTVRSPAGLYLHRLNPDRLPDVADVEAVTTAEEREISPGLPPVCDSCVRANPAARTNVRWRTRVVDDVHQACPDCHPTRVAILQQDTADGGMWDRAMARAQARMGARADAHTADDYASSSVDDLYGPRQSLKGTDAKVAGWLALSRQLSAQEKAGRRHQPYSDDHWHEPADPAAAARIPHCGAPSCDPFTRLKTEPDWTGEPHTSACDDCHPALKF